MCREHKKVVFVANKKKIVLYTSAVLGRKLRNNNVGTKVTPSQGRSEIAHYLNSVSIYTCMR